ncbi:MAG: MurR/RpiR family transcriptional regulator, partial [Planctomycetes bacterium]|nr:MurR/RpiR family transcriptional regulator [Planctomycetota bacterium]
MDKMTDIHARIRDALPRMSKAERRIGEYLLANDINILEYSAEELSRETETSAASIVRFCRTLGFKGYLELKFQVERNLVTFVGEDQQVDPGDDIATIQHKVLSYYASLVNDLHYALDPLEMKKAVDIIAGASQVHLYAEGGSASMAYYALNIFIHSGIYCRIEVDSSLQMMAAAYLGPGDVVLGITHSGRMINTLDALRLARANGAAIVAVTGNPDAPIKKLADVLLTANIKKPMYVSDLPSGHLEEFCILSVLQTALLVRDYDHASTMSKKVFKAVESKRVLRRP